MLRIITRMNIGGPAREVTALLHGLAADEFHQRLVTGAVSAGEAEFPMTGADVRRLPAMQRSLRPWRDLKALAGLILEIRRFRPTIVHTHTGKAGMLGRVAAWVCRVPIVVHTHHGHVLYGTLPSRVTAAVVRAERFLARFTTRLVAGGTAVRDELLAAGVGSAEQYAVMDPGVPRPSPMTKDDARTRLALPPDGLVVSFVGRLTRQKEPERFVDMAKALAQSRADTTFLIAGGGDLLEDLQRRAQPASHAIRFLGWVEDVAPVLGASDVVVLTSNNDGMPLSLVEAAFAGKPVVATDVGSTSEVVHDGRTGVLVPPETAAITAAVAKLLDDTSLRERMGAEAATMAEDRFTTERLVDSTAQLYRELLARCGSARRPARWVRRERPGTLGSPSARRDRRRARP